MKLLEHLETEGHEVILLGPHSGQDTYAGHKLVGTFGIPKVELFGLKASRNYLAQLYLCADEQFNFVRPKFLQVIRDFVGAANWTSVSRFQLTV